MMDAPRWRAPMLQFAVEVLDRHQVRAVANTQGL